METVKGKKFLVTGGTGFLGQNFVKYVIDNGGEADFFGSNYNLSILSEAERAFTEFNKTYDYIIHAAVLQGAGDWPLKHKAEQFDINCRIHTNTFSCWHKYQPQAKLIGIGSSCSYPGDIQELSETDYWNGAMHESVDIYGLTKSLKVLPNKVFIFIQQTLSNDRVKSSSFILTSIKLLLKSTHNFIRRANYSMYK